MTIGERLDKVLSISKLSVSNFAHEIGCTEKTFYNYRDNKTKPGIEVLSALANKFTNIDLKWLLTGEGEPMVNSGSVASIQNNNNQGNNTIHIATLGECEERVKGLEALLTEKERTIQEKDKRLVLLERLLDKS